MRFREWLESSEKFVYSGPGKYKTLTGEVVDVAGVEDGKILFYRDFDGKKVGPVRNQLDGRFSSSMPHGANSLDLVGEKVLEAAGDQSMSFGKDDYDSGLHRPALGNIKATVPNIKTRQGKKIEKLFRGKNAN